MIVQNTSLQRIAEHRLAQTLETMSDGFFTLNRDWTYTYINEAGAKQVGSTPEHLIGRRMFDLFPEAVDSVFAAAYARCFAEQIKVEVEDYYAPLDTWYSVRVYPDPNGISVYYQDISSQKRAERELQRLADIAASIQLGLYVWELVEVGDPGGMRLVYANPASEIASGLAPDAVLGKTMREAFPNHDPATAAILAEIAQGEQQHELGDAVYVNGGLPARTFSRRAFPLPGSRVGIAFSDITHEREIESNLATTIETMKDAFCQTELDGRITYVNAAFESMVGRSRAELVGVSIVDLAPLPDHETSYDELLRLAREQAVRDLVEVQVEGRDGGNRWITTRFIPTPDKLTIVARDNTERKELEEHLDQTEKLEALGSLAGAVAHNFNNLLSVIRHAAEIVSDGLPNGPDKEKLTQIDDAVADAAAITEQLLSFSRGSPQSPEPTDLNRVVDGTVGLLRPALGVNVELRVELTPDLNPIDVDRSQLQQLFLNLCLNARDAMPDGGTLTVRTIPTALDEVTAATGGLRSGGYAKLEISDTGTGIDPEIQHKIFDPFFTTKSSGTGLGLATVLSTVNDHGGQVLVDSRLGEGTTFKLLFPYSERPYEEPPHAPRETTSLTGTEAILLVDDNDTVRDLVAEVLENYGYTVRAARNAREATEIDQQRSTSFDLLLTDVTMPGISGVELAEQLLAVHPTMKVVIASGYPAATAIPHGIPDGDVRFIQKPFLGDELLQTIRTALGDAHRTSAESSS